MGSEHREGRMNIRLRYTRNQVARGARADAERPDSLFLLKNVSLLRLTYQIRLLAYRALTERRKLIIRVPHACEIHPPLREFQREHAKTVRIEKVKA